jgi:hypothetical protein
VRDGLELDEIVEKLFYHIQEFRDNN